MPNVQIVPSHNAPPKLIPLEGRVNGEETSPKSVALPGGGLI